MRWMVAGLVLLMLLGAHAAVAQPLDAATRDRGRALFRSGTVHYNLAEYEQALGDFTDGYRLTADPAFLFNIGQSERQLGHHEKAARAYRGFLRTAGEVANRAAIETLIADEEKAARSAATPAVAPVTAPPTATSESATTAAVTATPIVASAPAPVPSTPRSHMWLWVGLGAAAIVVVGAVVAVAATRGGAPDTAFGNSVLTFR